MTCDEVCRHSAIKKLRSINRCGASFFLPFMKYGAPKPPLSKGGSGLYAAGGCVDEMQVMLRGNPSTTLRAVPLPFGKGGELVVTLRFWC